MKKNTSKITAVGLMRLLSVSIFILAFIAVGTVYFLSNVLRDRVVETNQAKVDAEIGERDVQRIEQLEQLLQAESDTVTRAESIVADTKEYQYQDQIVNDITTYAKRTNVPILGFTFNQTGETTTATRGEAPTGSSSQANTNGLPSVSVVISLESPVEYADFLRFLKSIEQNLTKMQVKGVSLTPTEDPSLVANPSIDLEVFVRNQ